jgi:2-polyprenyl-6-methoxyphenol hydroxylase-like FAD-dependent oxidoreductase
MMSALDRRKLFDLLQTLQVLIIGAGPAGLLLAILLAQCHIPSIVLEAWDVLDNRLRATQYGVPATRIFRRAGILDDIRSESITSFPSIVWRNAHTKEKLAGIDLSVVENEADRMTVLPLNKLLRIMLRHCEEKYSDMVVVNFGHRVIDVRQDGEKAWAVVEAKAPERSESTVYEGDYVIGCDGGKSVVRKCLFGRHWPGQTFESRLLVQNVSIIYLSLPRLLLTLAGFL